MGEQRLQANVIGPWGLAALVIGVTSPAIGLYATWGPIEAMAGPVVPLVFLAALIITLPTVLSYACLNRYAPSAGAAAIGGGPDPAVAPDRMDLSARCGGFGQNDDHSDDDRDGCGASPVRAAAPSRDGHCLFRRNLLSGSGPIGIDK